LALEILDGGKLLATFFLYWKSHLTLFNACQLSKEMDMKNLLKYGFLVALGVASLPVQSAGNVEMGKAKAIFCTVCHGFNGEVNVPLWSGGTTRLAGMPTDKFVNALKAYRYGQRFHPFMQILVLPMSEQDMEDLAAYYASL
jgi:cytochrome c553